VSDHSRTRRGDIERAVELIDAEFGRVARWKAVHEAGHCVVALALHWDLDQASIERTSEQDAYARLKASKPNDQPIDYVRVGLAGALAVHIENRWGPMEPGQDGGATDERLIEAMLFARYPESDHAEVRERARRETLEILQSKWSQVEALASALETEGTLTRDRVIAIVGPFGDAGSADLPNMTQPVRG
jgi:hypothetical protein